MCLNVATYKFEINPYIIDRLINFMVELGQAIDSSHSAIDNLITIPTTATVDYVVKLTLLHVYNNSVKCRNQPMS